MIPLPRDLFSSSVEIALRQPAGVGTPFIQVQPKMEISIPKLIRLPHPDQTFPSDPSQTQKNGRSNPYIEWQIRERFLYDAHKDTVCAEEGGKEGREVRIQRSSQLKTRKSPHIRRLSTQSEAGEANQWC